MSNEPTAKAPVAAPWAPIRVSADQDAKIKLNTLHTSEVKALYAVSIGEADKEQQKRAFAAVLRVAATDDMSYRPEAHGGERDSVFAEGKRFVGLQLRKLVLHHTLYLNNND